MPPQVRLRQSSPFTCDPKGRTPAELSQVGSMCLYMSAVPFAHKLHVNKDRTTMSSLSVKRSLFQTPTRPSKRARGAKTPRRNSQVMRVPAYLKPETKQFTKDGLSLTSSSVYYSSIPTDITQGDGGNEFVGSKFRMTRLRVYYDYSNLTLTRGVRISVIIPKRALSLTSLYLLPWDTTKNTVLYDMLLPKDSSVLAGTFDVPGPINVHMDSTGTTAESNNIIIVVSSDNASARLQTTYTMWYTDA